MKIFRVAALGGTEISMSKGKVVAVVGPTASGKTALAISIAERFGGEVVSCDSMQIYKHMDIGTAKPTAEEQHKIPHHMIDIAEPWESYSVATFVKTARAHIDGILSRGRLPVLAGGTGLYIDSIINNIEFADYGSDEGYRAELHRLAKEKGAEYVHGLLAEKDPAAAEKIHQNNLRRVIRALEICRLSGKTFTEMNEMSRREPVYDALIFGLNVDRQTLYDRINNRVDDMIAAGLENEVKNILDIGVGRDTTAMQAIGYKEFIDYFEGRATLDETVEKIKQESRRYAKRQLTWFKRNPDIHWLMLQDCYSLNKIYQQCFTTIEKFGII